MGGLNDRQPGQSQKTGTPQQERFRLNLRGKEMCGHTARDPLKIFSSPRPTRACHMIDSALALASPHAAGRADRCAVTCPPYAAPPCGVGEPSASGPAGARCGLAQRPHLPRSGEIIEIARVPRLTRLPCGNFFAVSTPRMHTVLTMHWAGKKRKAERVICSSAAQASLWRVPSALLLRQSSPVISYLLAE